MTLHRLYNDLAWLWPVISPPEEYADESGYWRRALWGKLGEGRHRILELGSGGGHNLSHLTRFFCLSSNPLHYTSTLTIMYLLELMLSGSMKNLRLYN